MADSAEPTGQVTYTMIGADGNKYGPVDFATLRDWASEGRVLRQTVIIESPSGRQMTGAEVPGLFDGVQPPPMSSPRVEQPAEKKKTNAAVIAAVVVVGGCCLCVPVIAAILFPVFSQAKLAAKKTLSLSNVKQLSTGLIMYTGDYDDRYPANMASVNAMKPSIQPYVASESAYLSPNPSGGEYLGNEKLAGKPSEKVLEPHNTIMIYESMPWPKDVAVIGFADGHANAREPFSGLEALLGKDPFK